MRTGKSYRRMKRFWCEFFNLHEWEEVAQYEAQGIRYATYKCRKCRQEKSEPMPVMIPSIFGTYGDR